MKIISYGVALLFVFELMANDAYGYLDPGTGSMILQIFLGGAAGILIGWKFFWHRIKDMVTPGKKSEGG